MFLRVANNTDYMSLIEIWEASVRATHDFLKEDDLQRLKPLILTQYFDSVNLTAAVNKHGDVVGFSGIADGSIEMLFIAPEYRGQGIGRLLLRQAVDEQAATRVDVNEQNPAAIGFYQAQGFSVYGRSSMDAEGMPYPLLHMQLDA